MDNFELLVNLAPRARRSTDCASRRTRTDSRRASQSDDCLRLATIKIYVKVKVKITIIRKTLI